MVTTILLDLDDTILDFHRGESCAIRRTLSQLSLPTDDATVKLYSDINADEWRRLERGETTREELLVRRFARLFLALGVERDPVLTKRIYERMLGEQHDYMPGAKEALDRLSGRYDLYLVSNGTSAVQDRRLAAAGLIPYFRGIYISERVGYHKPRREFFDRVFADIGEERRPATVIVGDSLTSDIRGGVNAGLRTVWLNTRGADLPAEPVPDRTITAMAQLPEVLTTL